MPPFLTSAVMVRGAPRLLLLARSALACSSFIVHRACCRHLSRGRTDGPRQCAARLHSAAATGRLSALPEHGLAAESAAVSLMHTHTFVLPLAPSPRLAMPTCQCCCTLSPARVNLVSTAEREGVRFILARRTRYCALPPFFLPATLLKPGVESLTLPIIWMNSSLSLMALSRSFSCGVAAACLANTARHVLPAATRRSQHSRARISLSLSVHEQTHAPLPFLTPPGVSLTLYL